MTNSNTNENPARLLLRNVRAAWIAAFAPVRYQNKPDMPLKFTLTGMLPEDDPDVKRLQQAALAACVGKWGPEKGPQFFKELLQQGSQKCCISSSSSPNINWAPNGYILLACRNEGEGPYRKPPKVRSTLKSDGRLRQIVTGKDAVGQPIHEVVNEAGNTPSGKYDLYDGCHVDVLVEFWCQDNAYGKGLRCTFEGLKFAADGEPITGGTTDAEVDAAFENAFEDEDTAANDLGASETPQAAAPAVDDDLGLGDLLNS